MNITTTVSAMAERATGKVRAAIDTVKLRTQLRNDPQFLPEEPGEIDVLLNFPDGPMNLYQVRQWYGPLEHIRRRYRVAILCYVPETAEQIAQETNLKVILTPSFTDLSEVEEILQPKVILYPNQNYANYRILALTRSEHIFICHGESDKIYMASNWVKIFNYFFIAGQASYDRLETHVRNYDVERRTMRIGRPQIDIPTSAPILKPDGRISVLYSPTWEGGRSTMRYGSVASHGLAIVDSLLSDPRFQVIYRPHPRTGIHLADVEQADREIRRRLRKANDREPKAGHMVDSTPFGWQLDFADFMIADVSAVAYDWLTTAKPLLITRPVEPQTVMPESGYLAEAPLLNEADAPGTAALVYKMLSDPSIREAQSAWSDYYYGDRSPGVSLARFEAALEKAIAEIETFRSDHPDDSSATEETTILAGADADDVNDDGSAESPLKRYVRTGGTLIADQFARSRADAVVQRSLDSASAGRRSTILVTCMAHHRGLANLIDWLPVLAEVDQHNPVTILTGNLRTFERLRALTDLRVLLAYSAVDSENIVESLGPTLVVHFEQSTLNLREATFRSADHVYIGEDDSDAWINNRLRLFDVVLPSSQPQARLIERSLADLPPTVRLQVCAREDRAAALRDIVCAHGRPSAGRNN